MGKNIVVRAMRTAYLGLLGIGTLLLLIGPLLQDTVSTAHAAPANAVGTVDVALFHLPITPVSARYYARLIETAEADGAVALVIQLDTPGGLVDSMLDMVQRTLASRVPVIVYVSPSGAMSTSAGVFVTYAGHVAAMAPNTTIGSSEVLLNAGGEGSGGSTPESGDQAALRRKTTNLLVSKIRDLATLRGRDAEFAEKAVRESMNVGAQTAAERKVVDFVAADVTELLAKADGRQVEVAGGKATLKTKGAPTRNLQQTWVEELLFVITNPSVAFVLISLGTLGITWEFINPGAVFPGVVGAIMLLIGFLGVGTLPINAAGIAFMVLAFALFIADVFMPSHGILTAGGIISLVLGGLLLVNTAGLPPELGVSPYAVTGVATGLGAFFFFAVYKVVKARRRVPSTGREGLVGRLAETRTDLAPEGMVFVEGELWHAVSADGSIPSGEPVRVVAADGLRLRVLPERPTSEAEGTETRPL